MSLVHKKMADYLKRMEDQEIDRDRLIRMATADAMVYERMGKEDSVTTVREMIDIMKHYREKRR